MRGMLRRKPVALTVALAFAACTPAQERSQQSRDAVGEAIERGDREAALDAISDLRAWAPDTADAQLEIALLLVQAGNAPEAGWLLEDAVRRHPDRADLALVLARVSLLLGNPTRARAMAGGIDPGAPEHGAALIVRGQAELHLGDLEQALDTLGEAERLYPDQPEARLVRIATLLSEHRQDEARTAIAEARAGLEGHDEETVALRRHLDLTLAQIQAQQGEAEVALTSLEGLLASDPSDLLAWRALVQVLAQQERAEEALSRLEAALAAEEPLADLYALAAQMYAMLGHDEEAEAALRTFMARSESAAAVLPLLQFHSARRDAEAARQVLDEAIARTPDASTLRLLRTETLLAQDEDAEARAEFARFRDATFEDDPQIEYLRARFELADGDADGAANRLRNLAPRLDRAPTHFWLGRALEERGDIEGARRRYALAQRRDPHWAAPGAALIALEQRRGDWRAVAGQARLHVQHSPQEIGVWIALVEALENLGEGAAAEQVARRFLEQSPDRAEPHVLLAKALRAQGKTDEALAALDEAERIEASPELAAERILTLGMGGRVEDGVAVARTALAADSDSADLHAALAALLFASEAAQEGAEATDRALALDPDEPGPLRIRCEFRVATGDWRGARDDCTRYLAARPDGTRAHFMLGLAHAGLGDADAAIAAYRRAAQLDERDARSRNNLAELLAAQGDLDGALAAAQEAYRLDEQNPYVKDTLGALYLRKRLPGRAVSLLEEAHARLPEMGEVTLNLALAYRDAGRREEARALLTDLQPSVAGNAALEPQVEEALRSLQ